MLTIAGAILQHSFRIMTFRHDGRGLPAERGGAMYLLMTLFVVSRLLRDVVDPDGFNALVTMLTCGAFLGMMSLFTRPTPMAILLLAMLMGNLATGLLTLAGFKGTFINAGIIGWELIAMSVTLSRLVDRAKADHKKKKHSEKHPDEEK